MKLYKLSLIRPKYILCFEVLAESNTLFYKYKCLYCELLLKNIYYSSAQL